MKCIRLRVLRGDTLSVPCTEDGVATSQLTKGSGIPVGSFKFDGGNFILPHTDTIRLSGQYKYRFVIDNRVIQYGILEVL